MANSRNAHLPVENTSHLKFVPTVLERTTCLVHGREKGNACWNIHLDRQIVPAVCNARATSAGMNGRISPTSFMVRSAKKH